MGPPDPNNPSNNPGLFGLVLVSILKTPLQALKNQNQVKLISDKKQNNALVSNLFAYEKVPTWKYLKQLRQQLALAHATHPIPLEPSSDLNCIFDHLEREVATLREKPGIEDVTKLLERLEGLLNACLDAEPLKQTIKHVTETCCADELPWIGYEKNTPGDVRRAEKMLGEPTLRRALEDLRRFCHHELNGYSAPPLDCRLLARRLLCIPDDIHRLDLRWIEVTVGLKEIMSGEWMRISGPDQGYLTRSGPLAVIVKENLCRQIADGRSPGAAPQVSDTRRDELVHAGTVVFGLKLKNFTTHGSSRRPWTHADESGTVMRLRHALTSEDGSAAGLEKFRDELLAFVLRWDPIARIQERLKHVAELDGRTFDLATLERLESLRKALRVLCDPAKDASSPDLSAKFVAAASADELRKTANSKKRPPLPASVRRMQSIVHHLGDANSFMNGQELGRLRSFPTTDDFTDDTKKGCAKAKSALWFLAGWRRGLYPSDRPVPNKTPIGEVEPDRSEATDTPAENVQGDPIRLWVKAVRDLYDLLRCELDGYEQSAAIPAYRVAGGGALLCSGLRDILRDSPPDEPLLLVHPKDDLSTMTIVQRSALLDGFAVAVRAAHRELAAIEIALGN